MPIAVPQTTSAVINFSLPAHRLDHDQSIYMTYYPGRPKRPSEAKNVELNNLRPDLDSGESVWDQVNRRGFAVARHTSTTLGGIDSVEGSEAYQKETCELMRSYLGCTKVIQWNTTCRKAEPGISFTPVDRQTGPEKDFNPVTRIQPPAGGAHVDQDEIWGKKVIKIASGIDADDLKRSMIINLWRPRVGPVTCSPLAMLSFPTLEPSTHTAKGTDNFGTGIGIHYSPTQSWGYIKHQMPDELVVLKCYDSAQGTDGSALYGGHSAVDIDVERERQGVPPEQWGWRESVEVRTIAIWE